MSNEPTCCCTMLSLAREGSVFRCECGQSWCYLGGEWLTASVASTTKPPRLACDCGFLVELPRDPKPGAIADCQKCDSTWVYSEVAGVGVWDMHPAEGFVV